jgi:uncharacterized RDD family membrane protein YckC
VWRRCAAFCYDALLLTALAVVFTLIVLAARHGAPVPPGSFWFPLCLVGIAMAFFCGFWVRGGQTVGMRAWRIKVVRDDGESLRWSQAAARFGAGLLAALPAGLGLWWSIFDSRKRAWHDRWTRTCVVRVHSPAAR